MSIEEEILKAFEKVDETTKLLLRDTVSRMIFLQSKLREIEQKPFVKYHPTDNTKQKVLPSYKMYVSLTQQYNNIVFKLCSLLIKNNDKDHKDSPLREYLESIKNGKR